MFISVKGKFLKWTQMLLKLNNQINVLPAAVSTDYWVIKSDKTSSFLYRPVTVQAEAVPANTNELGDKGCSANGI